MRVGAGSARVATAARAGEPAPCAFDHAARVFPLGFPAEDGLGFGWVGDEFGWIAFAAWSEGEGDGFTGDFFDEFEHLEDADAGAGAEVAGGGGAAFAEMGEGVGVGLGEVEDVDVVADAGTVGGGVVVTEDGEGGDFTGDGHEGARDEVGFGFVVFADGGVVGAAAGIEVAEHDVVDAAGADAVDEDAFEHEFAHAVGVDGCLGVGFVHGDEDWVAVGGAGGGEDELAAVVALHGFEQRDGGGEIVPVVLEGIGDGFTDEGVGGEVEDGLDGLGAEDGVHGGGIAEIGLDEGDGGGDEGVAVAEFEGIDDDDLFAGFSEHADGVRTDVSGAAGDENGHDEWGD